MLPLSELIKMNIETYLRTGEYVTTRRLSTAFKMAATTMKNIDMMMTHNDFAQLGGYAMDPSGRVYPQTVKQQEQETSVAASRPATPTRQSSRPSTPMQQLTRQLSGSSLRPSTPSNERSRTPTSGSGRSSTPRSRSTPRSTPRSNSGFFSFFSSSKGNDEEAARSSTPKSGGAVFNFFEVDDSYPWSTWTNEGVVSSLRPLSESNYFTHKGSMDSIGSLRSISTAGNSPSHRSPQLSPDKRKSKQRKQLSLELTAENLQSHLSEDEDEDVVETKCMDRADGVGARSSASGGKHSTPKSRIGGSAAGLKDSGDASSKRESSKNGSTRNGNTKGSRKKKNVPYKEVTAYNASTDTWDGYDDFIAESQKRKDRHEQMQQALVNADILTSQNVQAARESAAERERNNMKALRLLGEQVHEEQEGKGTELRTHESFTRESSEVKKLLKARKDPQAHAVYAEQQRSEAGVREQEQEQEREQAELETKREKQEKAEQRRLEQEMKEAAAAEEVMKQAELEKAEAERNQAANRLQRSFVRNPNVLLGNRRRSSVTKAEASNS